MLNSFLEVIFLLLFNDYSKNGAVRKSQNFVMFAVCGIIVLSNKLGEEDE